MSLTELMPAIRTLTGPDKLHLIRILAEDLAAKESSLASGTNWPVWAPYNAHGAANVLLAALAEDQKAG